MTDYLPPVDAGGRRLIGFVGSLVIVGALCFGWGRCTCPHEKAGITASTIDYRVDTITKVITREPIYVRAKAHVVYDTIRTTDTSRHDGLAYEARLDTIVHQDTLSIRFQWPRAEFALSLRQRADSIQVEYKTVTITNTNYEKREWWMDALTHIGAFGIGAGIGSLVK